MSANLASVEGLESAQAVVPRGLRPVPRWQAWLWAPLKFTAGALLTQSLLGSVIVFGWLQRWTARSVCRAWWRRSPMRRGSFSSFAAEEPLLREHIHAPNW